jgi:predicted nucleotide-binding protein (sugar kinase/HSP70/actin superfamily)
MMQKKIMARVQVTVEIDVRLDNWTADSTVDQVHREGCEKAVAEITKLCQRYVRLIGRPKVEAVITESDR